jgi:thymidylate synthase (FAD)
MKIIDAEIQGVYTLAGELNLNTGIGLLRQVEQAGRISHRSEQKMTDDSFQRFIEAVVLKHGDWSIVEHANVTVQLRVDRGITHEIVRHRLFSFTQESTRFCNYNKVIGELEVIYPEDTPENTPEEQPDEDWLFAIKTAEAVYFRLLEKGWKPESARSVLPTCLASTIVITGNLRQWRHFFLMRTTRETHPDCRLIAIPLLNKFQTSIPLLFEDIVPLARQIDNLSKAR